MSANVFNLRRARKAAKRDKAEAQAATNRVTFGLSAVERKRMKAEQDRGVRHLDQHKLTPTDP